MRTIPRLLALGLLLAAGSLAVTSPADSTPTSQRLLQSSRAERYRVATGKSTIEAGAARIAVGAPVDQVTKTVTAFERWEATVPKFQRARVVGRHGDETDVYLQVPILKGAAKVWAVVRFAPPRNEGGRVVITGKMLQGNVDALDAQFVVRPIDAGHTQLDLQMLIVPKLPAPGALVTGEVAYAADQAVTKMRDAAEGKL
jgi:carbon monoxide dehydrogenase subunit G